MKQRNSLDLLGSDLRDVYGQYKDAQDYETFNKLKAGSIDDVKAYIDEMKAAGTEKIVKENQRILGAATADIEIDTGKYLYQDQIDRAQDLLEAKKYTEMAEGKTVNQLLEEAYSAFTDDHARYSDLRNYALMGNKTQEEYEQADEWLSSHRRELEAQLTYIKRQQTENTRTENVNGYAAKVPADLELDGRLKAEESTLIKQIEQLGADLESIREISHFSEYEEEYNSLDSSVREAIDELANYELGGTPKLAQKEGETYLNFHNFVGAEKQLRTKGYSKDDIDRLVTRRKRIINRDKAIAESEKQAEFARKYAVLANAGSVLTSLLSGIYSIPEIIRGGIQGHKGYEYGVDRYSKGYAPVRFTKNVRDTTSQGIESDIGRFVYQTGMSIIDSAAAMGIGMATGGVASAAGGVANAVAGTVTNFIMSSSAGANAIYEGLEKGYSNEKALLLGISAGLIEAASEKLSIDKILESIKTDKFLMTLGKSAIAEGSEELVSNWGNRMMDVLVNKSQNEVYQAILSYQDQGYSSREALARALTDMAGDDAAAFLGGALSGMAMAGAGKVGDIAIQKAERTAQNHSDTKAVIQNGTQEELARAVVKNLSGSQNKSDSAMVKRAQEYLDSIDNADNAKDLTNKEIRQMMGAVNKHQLANIDEATVHGQKKALTEEFERRGVQSKGANPETLANVAYKKLTGQEMTEAEQNWQTPARMWRRWSRNCGRTARVLLLNSFMQKQKKAALQAVKAADDVYQNITGKKVEHIVHPLVAQDGNKVVRLQEIEALHEDGSMTVTVRGKKGTETESRRITPADISDGMARFVYEAAAETGSTRAAQALIRAAAGETNVPYQQMPDVFEAYYSLGQAGIALDGANTGGLYAFNTQGVKAVSEQFKKLAYEAGKADAQGLTGVTYNGGD